MSGATTDDESIVHPSAPELAIIVVNWNTREHLRRSLHSVQEELEDQEDLRAHVVVIDNASTDGSQSMVRGEFPWVALIENSENIGFAAATNMGFESSDAEHFLLLNSDAELNHGTIAALLLCLRNDSRAGAAGPLMVSPDGTMQQSYGTLPNVVAEIIGPYRFDFATKPWGSLGRHFFARSSARRRCRQVERVSFACTVIRREALDQVGTLDERYGFYSEDYDWFHRLRAAGRTVLFCPEAVVVHHWGMSSGQRAEWAHRQLYRSKRLYHRKHHGIIAESILRLGLCLRFSIKLLLALALYPAHHDQSLRQVRLNRLLLSDLMNPVDE